MKYFSIIIIVVLFSCSKEDKYKTEFRTLLRIQNQENINYLNKKLYLVTDLDGCNACMEHTVKFINKNINNDNMIFIVSGRSKIILKSKFSSYVLKNKNFIFDSTMIAFKGNIATNGFPQIFLCNEGNIVESFEVPYTIAKEKFQYAEKFTNN